MSKKLTVSPRPRVFASSDYGRLVADISGLLEQARRTTVRVVNSILTPTYWEVGHRIVEYEQGGKSRAGYGEELLARLSKDLMVKHGRGFSERNIRQMRTFYLGWEIWQTPSAKLEARVRPVRNSLMGTQKRQTLSAESTQSLGPALVPVQPEFMPAKVFPLSWSQYVRLMSVENPLARAFYEVERA